MIKDGGHFKHFDRNFCFPPRAKNYYFIAVKMFKYVPAGLFVTFLAIIVVFASKNNAP